MEPAARSLASRQIEDARLNYTEVFRLHPALERPWGLFRMKTTIDVTSLIERVACLHYPWDSQRNAERLPDSHDPLLGPHCVSGCVCHDPSTS